MIRGKQPKTQADDNRLVLSFNTNPLILITMATIDNQIISVHIKELVQAIEKKVNPEKAYQILQEIGINYDPGCPAQSWNKFHNVIEEEQPNPNHYPDTPQGDADFNDDYWQGNIEAMLYHDDMGDR